ncbi:hypothetical protein TEA_015999 [Camellia sinensis var. sinensis]|uniref:Alanyl-transfer RNA synthetases family profile domain-containing protein n=1 Tax=Camellia sinensis var. sinensis TaxID=542762 RepID=A0A4S4DQC9_CAMSN|nr:hypothetical protein TEA_015999 [Camellia sinensis var. sinensis]
MEIKDIKKSVSNIFVRKGTIKEGSIEVGGEVEAAVDAKLRQRAKVHHTATHLLQAVLKKVVGQETSQAGSLVAFDRLRFDFNFHRPLLDNELMEIEELINSWIKDSTLLQTKVMHLTDAKKAGAIAMFEEKYGEQVPGVSMELCGGTHVSSTSEIRGLKIISEQGIASGIRRIEAVADSILRLWYYLRNLDTMLHSKALLQSLLGQLLVAFPGQHGQYSKHSHSTEYESNATCGKRLSSIGPDNTKVNWQAYRQLLLTNPGLGEYISGAILFEKTLYQSTTNGKKFVNCLREQNIVPGIKVNKGLDGLASRSAEYYKQGARFAKWHTVVSIPCGPSALAVKEAAWGLARYAGIS